MFLQLESLKHCLRSRVPHVLNELPDGLDETYGHVLKEIHKSNRGHVRRLLQCLAVARRPLRVDEAVAILTFDPDAIEGEVLTLEADLRPEDQEKELLSACPSLITIVGPYRSRVVQFSHSSVKEFLISDRLSTSSEDISCYHILPEAAHTTLAQVLLEVLLRLDDRINRWNAETIPLAQYAAEHWAFHARLGSPSSRLMGPMKTLFDPDKPYFAAWLQIYDPEILPIFYFDNSRFWDSRRNTPKVLYYSVHCGIYDLVEHLLKKHSQYINAIGGLFDYPLFVALHEQDTRIAELLIQHGANVEVHGKAEQTPLHEVITSRFNVSAVVDRVQVLLKHGADVNARDSELWTPLHLAADEGHFEVAQILLEHKADVNSRAVCGATPLHLVGINRYFSGDSGRCPDLVQLFLEYGAEVNSRDQSDSTPLHHAMSPEVARALLNQGANVNAEDNRRRTPLHRVLDKGIPADDLFDIAQLLVERGADVNAQDNDRETPLHLASYNSCYLELKSVRALLDHGADVNAKGMWGQTPLHYVSKAKIRFNYYRSGAGRGVAHLLIDHGADVNAQDEDYETPLHLAACHLWLEMAWILLERGADPKMEDHEGNIPFQLARESMREEVERPPSEYSIRHAQRVRGVVLMGLLYGYQEQVSTNVNVLPLLCLNPVYHDRTRCHLLHRRITVVSYSLLGPSD